MSWRLMDAVCELGLRDEQFRLLMALARHAQDDGSSCFPGVERLMRETHKSERAVQYGLRQLEALGLIVRVAHAQGGRGHTTQYHLLLKGATDCTLSAAKGCNPASERVQPSVVKGATGCTPIDQEPVSKEPVSIPVPDGRIDSLFAYYRERILPLARLCPREKLRARLKRFSESELREAIEHFAADGWWMSHNAHRGAEWFFKSDARIEQFLLLTPRQEADDGGSGPVARTARNGSGAHSGGHLFGRQQTSGAEMRRQAIALGLIADPGAAQ